MTYTLDQLQKAWNKLIADSKFERLFKDMDTRLNPRSDAYQTFLQLSSRYCSTYRDAVGKGIISQENAQLSFNQISNGLIELIKNLQQEDISTEASNHQHPLDVLAQQLDVKVLLTPLYLVNCNRSKAFLDFNKSYRKWKEKEQGFQFYYILACPTQEPEGFTERVIYEIMGKMEEDHRNTIHYPRSAGNERVLIDPLPFELDLQDSKEAFKKYFARRFNLGNTDFETYLNTGLTSLKVDYIITALSVTAKDLYTYQLEEYLQWLMDCFSTIEGRAPKFLFFFVISLKNAFKEKIRPDDLEALESVRALVAQNNEHATLVSKLPPVPADDLEDWLEKLGNIPQIQKDQIIETIAAGLSPEESERFLSEDKLLNMEHIEDFQERVYKFHR